MFRKKNKLPAETHSVDFELEYGTATIEVHKDSINKNDGVLIVDDLIATGGTGVFSYQWYSNTVNNTTSGTIITGETSDNYTPPTSVIGTK